MEAHAVVDLGRRVAMVEGFRAPKLLLAWSPRYGHAALDAFVVDVETWQIIREFRIESEVGFELASNYSREPDLRVTSDGIFAGSDGEYLLREFDWRGRLRRAVTRDSDLLAAPDSSMQRAARVGMGDVSAPFVLPGGHWIAMGRWIRNKNELEQIFERETSSLATRDSIVSAYFLDVFGPSGMLLGSLSWEGERPAFARFTGMDQNGDVYSKADDPFPHVRRYRVDRIGGPSIDDSDPS